MRSLNAISDVAGGYLSEVKNRQGKEYDMRMVQKPHPFVEGMKVMVNDNFEKSHKLGTPWTGPYYIKKIDGSKVTLQIWGQKQNELRVVNLSRLKICPLGCNDREFVHSGKRKHRYQRLTTDAAEGVRQSTQSNIQRMIGKTTVTDQLNAILYLDIEEIGELQTSTDTNITQFDSKLMEALPLQLSTRIKILDKEEKENPIAMEVNEDSFALCEDIAFSFPLKDIGDACFAFWENSDTVTETGTDLHSELKFKNSVKKQAEEKKDNHQIIALGHSPFSSYRKKPINRKFLRATELKGSGNSFEGHGEQSRAQGQRARAQHKGNHHFKKSAKSDCLEMPEPKIKAETKLTSPPITGEWIRTIAYCMTQIILWKHALYGLETLTHRRIYLEKYIIFQSTSLKIKKQEERKMDVDPESVIPVQAFGNWTHEQWRLVEEVIAVGHDFYNLSTPNFKRWKKIVPEIN
jgi:hypothetical protein